MLIFILLCFSFSLQVGAYRVGTDLLVEFEFRTTRMNGVLLGVSSQKMDGLGIELVDGKVSSKAILFLHKLVLESIGSLNARSLCQSQDVSNNIRALEGEPYLDLSIHLEDITLLKDSLKDSVILESSKTAIKF